MQSALRTKRLIGILDALATLGIILAHQLRANQQTADATSKLAAEREKAAQMDRDDKAAIEKIREHNAQKANTASNK